MVLWSPVAREPAPDMEVAGRRGPAVRHRDDAPPFWREAARQRRQGCVGEEKVLTEFINNLPLLLLLEGAIFVGLAYCIARVRRVRAAGGIGDHQGLDGVVDAAEAKQGEGRQAA